MKNLTIVGLIALMLGACGSENNEMADDHADASPGADACEHMLGGPATAVTAAAVGAQPPTLSDTHTRFDVAAAAGEPALLRVSVTEATEMHFFFDQDVTLSVATATGDAVAAAEDIAAVDDCGEVAEGAAFELGVGTYGVEVIAPADRFSMVLIPGSHEGHSE